MMDTLEAVNEMLEVIGETPATALDTDGASDEADAERILDRRVKRVLLEGWTFNTIQDKAYPVGHDSRVSLIDSQGNGVLSLGPSEKNQQLDLAIRDGYLYDRKNDTDEFSGFTTIYLNVIEDLPFVSMPESMQEYVVASAKRDFARYKQRSTIDETLIERDVMMARSRLMREQDRQNQTNTTTDYNATQVKGHRLSPGAFGLHHY